MSGYTQELRDVGLPLGHGGSAIDEVVDEVDQELGTRPLEEWSELVNSN